MGDYDNFCVDIDDCAKKPCGTKAGTSCTDKGANKWQCSCPAGYSLFGSNSDQQSCRMVDACKASEDDCATGLAGPVNKASCQYSSTAKGGHVCQCPKGYIGDGKKKGSGCKDINKCSPNPCAVLQGSGTRPACTDKKAPSLAYSCAACPGGYSNPAKYVSGKLTCVDTNGCASTPCHSLSSCTDKKAPSTGFTCAACPSGFKGNAVGSSGCTDVDDCANSPCGKNQDTCTDTGTNRYKCTCAPGYSSLGSSTQPKCLHVDACKSGEDDCVGGWTLVASTWISAYDSKVPAEFKNRGQFITSDVVGTYGTPSQVRLQCQRSNGYVDMTFDWADVPYPSQTGRGLTEWHSWNKYKGKGEGVANGTLAGWPRFIVRRGGGSTGPHCGTGYSGVGGEKNNPRLGMWARVYVKVDGTVLARCNHDSSSSSGAPKHTCSCPSGFVGDGKTKGTGCKDYNACSTNRCAKLQGSSTQLKCADKAAPSMGYTCSSCPTGYDTSPVNGVCVDTNACKGNPCHSLVSCADVKAPGTGFRCSACPSGYSGNGVGGSGCQDVNDCARSPCGSKGSCTDYRRSPNTWVCSCPAGYSSLPSGSARPSCQLVNKCQASEDDCATGLQWGSVKFAKCIHDAKRKSKHYCVCPAGYKGDGTKSGSGCKDFNACPGSPCAKLPAGGKGTAPACTDKRPPFTDRTCAACPTGYNSAPRNGYCVDYDACANNPCHSLSACTDLKAPSTSFSCKACPAGYSGNAIGSSGCKDINDCATNPCGKEGKSCTDTGTLRYKCTCNAGYASLGSSTRPTCTHVDACASNEDDCVGPKYVNASGWALVSQGWIPAYDKQVPQEFKKLGQFRYGSVWSTLGSFSAVVVQCWSTTVNINKQYSANYARSQGGGTLSEWHRWRGGGGGAGYNRFIVRDGSSGKTGPHCGAGYTSVGGEANNPRLGQYGRVWVKLDKTFQAKCNHVAGSKSPPKHTCTCPTGYTGDGRRTGSGCKNYNACATNRCARLQGKSSRVKCTDAKPPSMGYSCASCPTGYDSRAVNGVCADTNGCAGSSNPCHSLATCYDRKAPRTGATCGGCPSGYSGNGYKSSGGCTDKNDCSGSPCGTLAGMNCKDTGANKYSCTCPTGYKSLGSSTKPKCLHVNQCSSGENDCQTHHPWVHAGYLRDLPSIERKYPLTSYDYGVKYNAAYSVIHSVMLNSWNRGVRVTIYPMYPQGDTASNMKFGTALFVKGTDDSKTDWTQHYYGENGNGLFYRWAGNGARHGSVSLWVTARTNPWVQVGNIGNMHSMISKYPHYKYEFGVRYNSAHGAVHTVMLNSWNRGTRVSAYPMYPHGDNGRSLRFGTTVFFHGTGGQSHTYQQYYYKQVSTGLYKNYGGNGNGAGVSFWVSERRHPWKQVGTLKTLPTVASKYPSDKYDWAVQYNAISGAMHKVTVNSWNVGVRVTVAPLYPQGDTASSMTFGTTTFVRGTHDSKGAAWTQYYYKQNSKGMLYRWAGNGNRHSGVRMYAIKREAPWKSVGTLSQLDAIIKQYPSNLYDYAVRYNTAYNSVHQVTLNSWNRGTRITVAEWYPQGDNGKTLQFGQTVFVKGTHDTKTYWKQFYYKQNSNGMRVQYHSNGNANGIQFLVSQRVPGSTCNHNSNSKPGQPTHTCSCASGYTGDGKYGGNGCQDINGCQTTRCASIPRGGAGSAPTCRDKPAPASGGTCAKCPSGYNPSPASYGGRSVCVDANDCSANKKKCGPAASGCKEAQPGSGKYTCVCASRFKLSSNFCYLDARPVTGSKNAKCVSESDMLKQWGAVHMGFCAKPVDRVWKRVGALRDMSSIVSKYPHYKYDFGVKYNAAYGVVHTVVMNSWNRGVRISIYPFYPQLDNGASMKFGTALFVKGTDDSKTSWTQHYYGENSRGKMVRWAGNGNADGIGVYATARYGPWVRVGRVTDINTIVSKYSHMNYEYAVQYNSAHGAMHTVQLNSWNRGTRISVYPLYPQGDNGRSLWYGTTTFMNGLSGQKHTWQQYYFRQNSNAHLENYAGNGNGASISFFASKRLNPWVRIGNIAQSGSLMGSAYKPTHYDYAVTYNSGKGCIHDVVINSWNRGIRISVWPLYPQGDSVHVDFGTTSFVYGVDDSKNTWTQHYYKQNGNGKLYRWAGNGANHNGVSFYAKKREAPWMLAGNLAGLDNIIKKYRPESYDYAVRYNSAQGSIHAVTLNSWNRGTRVTVAEWYPQGDRGATMTFGQTLFVKGTHDATTYWKQYYYQQNSNGMRVQVGSNGNANGIQFWVSERTRSCAQ